MSAFVGISLSSPLDPQKYLHFLEEIEDSQVTQIEMSECIVTLFNGYHQFHLPRSSHYLFSNLQHIEIGGNEDEDFLAAVVESLLTLQEYFPHQVLSSLLRSRSKLCHNLKLLTI